MVTGFTVGGGMAAPKPTLIRRLLSLELTRCWSKSNAQRAGSRHFARKEVGGYARKQKTAHKTVSIIGLSSFTGASTGKVDQLTPSRGKAEKPRG